VASASADKLGFCSLRHLISILEFRLHKTTLMSSLCADILLNVIHLSISSIFVVHYALCNVHHLPFSPVFQPLEASAPFSRPRWLTASNSEALRQSLGYQTAPFGIWTLVGTSPCFVHSCWYVNPFTQRCNLIRFLQIVVAVEIFKLLAKLYLSSHAHQCTSRHKNVCRLHIYL
jgi:hypothetical protein